MSVSQRSEATATLRPGVYTPLPTFFYEDEELNLVEYRKHLLLPVCAGSLGEAVHLSREERSILIRCTRETLDEQGFESVPIVAGVGGLSTRETIQLAKDAFEAGATVGMVIPPAYYAAILQQDSAQIEQYYVDICKGSPMPLLLYNFPANSAGQDLSASTIQAIIERSPKLCGVKLTYGSYDQEQAEQPLTYDRCQGRMEKLTHISALVETSGEKNFLILDGVMSDLSTWRTSGGHGTVSGISNIAPMSTVRLWTLCCLEIRSEKEDKELEEVLSVLSRVDAVIMPLGVRGLKFALAYLYGYGKNPRKPLLSLDKENRDLVVGLLNPLSDMEKRYGNTVLCS
ncbi:putative dihydrodipicolinate synthase [Aureobasidium subglaciale]|nr:putative dihydrodipicolinate synthase [Aureobasidium subglaciale]KAI5226468.1 putative dihydrodipicolinate synthase [Aureobasidium subglaciale]KAI5229967.1 putative dihydrodipicolinate synthase [Aureobasidium subglaciale]KAI5264348.1 putative dihydrodipicolinate synthase [Aureobasidium subglaciale]